MAKRAKHADDEGSHFIVNQRHARIGEMLWHVKKRDALSATGSITVGGGGSQEEALAMSRDLNRHERAQKKLNPEQFRHSFS